MVADIIVIAVVAVFVAAGYKAGLIRSFMGIASYIISIIIAFLIYPVVSGFLVKTPLYTYLTEMVNNNYVSENMQSADTGMFGFFSKHMSEGLDAVATTVSEEIAALLINIIAFILVIVISRILIWLITKVLNIFSKLPVIKQFNRLGGALLGGIKGILILYIVFAIVTVFVPFKENGVIVKGIEESSFAGAMYEDNIILNLIGKGESEN